MVREGAGLQCEITECGQEGMVAELEPAGLACLGGFVHVDPSFGNLQLYRLGTGDIMLFKDFSLVYCVG